MRLLITFCICLGWALLAVFQRDAKSELFWTGAAALCWILRAAVNDLKDNGKKVGETSSDE